MPGMSEILTLRAVTRSADAYQTASKIDTDVYAEKLPLYSGEFHSARASGFDLQHIMRVHAFEYSGQKAASYKGQEYEIYRTYQKNDDWIELYLSTKESA